VAKQDTLANFATVSPIGHAASSLRRPDMLLLHKLLLLHRGDDAFARAHREIRTDFRRFAIVRLAVTTFSFAALSSSALTPKSSSPICPKEQDIA
jgi:hypothetical protein